MYFVLSKYMILLTKTTHREQPKQYKRMWFKNLAIIIDSKLIKHLYYIIIKYVGIYNNKRQQCQYVLPPPNKKLHNKLIN